MLKRSVLVAAVLLTATACGSSSPEKTNSTPSPPADQAYAASPSATPTIKVVPSKTPPVMTTGSCTYSPAGAAAKAARAPGSSVDPAKTHVTLTTNRGAIALTLDAKNTPCTTNSFVSLASQHYFDGTNCHRLTTSGILVLQCGDPSGTGMGGPGYQFNDELTPGAKPKTCTPDYCIYPAGTVAMANSGPGTNGSQFFLVYADSPLPYNYTIFGHMDAAGLNVVKTIGAEGTDSGAGDGAPKSPVTIETATVN